MTTLEDMTVLERILAGTNISLQVLQARLLAVMSMLFTFSLFCAAMWMQTQAAIVTAVAFALLVFLPVLAGIGDKSHAKHATAQATRPAAEPAEIDSGRGNPRVPMALSDHDRAPAHEPARYGT